MEKSDRETRDFMNVESFSQLPFIRPTPPKDSSKLRAIRLFGKEFGNNNNIQQHQEEDQEEADSCKEEEEEMSSSTAETSSRKFECHYCCRNFPTSQALGGHQNAHKRERQQAKRAHLQSAMHTDAHLYGLINYTRFAAAAPPLPMPPTYHQSWNHHATRQLYHHHQPINGSPLALWRLPPRPMQHQLPHFTYQGASKHEEPNLISTTSPFRFPYESKPHQNHNNNSIHEHVSLDLHL